MVIELPSPVKDIFSYVPWKYSQEKCFLILEALDAIAPSGMDLGTNHFAGNLEKGTETMIECSREKWGGYNDCPRNGAGAFYYRRPERQWTQIMHPLICFY